MSSTNPTNLKEVRKFGFIAVLFFGCLFGIGVWRGKSVPTYFFGTLSSFGLGLLVLPKKLLPLYKGWNKVGYLIGKVITTTLMTISYYLVITPAALVKNILGDSPLPLSPDKNCSSYWIKRKEPAQPKEQFLKRF